MGGKEPASFPKEIATNDQNVTKKPIVSLVLVTFNIFAYNSTLVQQQQLNGSLLRSNLSERPTHVKQWDS